MARQVLPVVGALVGGYFGGASGAQAGWAIGAAVGGAVDPVKNVGPRIGETGAQTSSEGAPRAIVYGTAPVTGNVICCGPLIKADVETQDSGGKGSGPTTSTERCYRTFAIRICEGPIAGVLRIWEDDKLVYDVRPSSLMLAESAQWIFGCGIWLGTEDQPPDPFLQINVNPDMPAYRGTAYMTFVFRDLTDRRGSIPQYRFEVAGTASTAPSNLPLVVYPWRTDQEDPRNPDNDHSYSYSGFAPNTGSPQPYPTGSPTTRTDLEAAIGDMYSGWNGDSAQAAPPSLGVMKRTGFSDLTGFFPAQTITGTQQQALLFHFNENDAAAYHVGAALPVSAWPAISDGEGGLWGAASSSSSVAYRADTYSRPGQWKGVNRRHATETYTNQFSDGLEGFYTLDGFITVKRVPVPPAGFTKVIGEAKQLAAVAYDGVGGDLRTNGLGPVLLPGDPDYDNADFWDAAAAQAIDDGTLPADAIYPVVVDAYATGYVTLAGLPVPLDGIVADIATRCGLPAEKFDVSELADDETLGLVLAGDYTGADAIDVLRGPYFFDKAEYDKKIWFPKRGKAVVATLTIDDLVEEPDTSTREQAAEYPKKFHLFYQNAVAAYAVVKATSQRSSSDVRVTGEQSAQVPIVMDADTAAQTSSKMHKVTWAEADGEVAFSLPLSFIRLVPSDCIGLSLRGRVSRLRIDQMDNADGILPLTCRHDRQSAYTSNVTGIPIPEPTPPPATIVGSTVLAVLDIPSRLDTEDDLNIYYGVTGAQPAWYGAAVQRSLDGGASFTTAASIQPGNVIGYLLADVPSKDENFIDTTSTVSVRLYRQGQALESLTDTQFLSEGGAFALEKADGSYEILQYRDVVEDSGGDFELSHLTRGRLNSGASAHLAGALFVMLDRVTHIPAQASWIGQPLTHRAVSFGQSPELADEQTETYAGRSQLEWPVAYLALARDGADVITATWTPRHRFGTDDAPVASINFQGYRITLDDGILPAVLFDSAAANFTYDASALGSPLSVSVSALNRITGAGPATSGTV